MKARSMKLISALLLATVSSIAVSAQAQELKIGYVNGERVLREAEPAKRAAAKLEAEFGKRQKELNDQSAAFRAQADKLDRDSPTLSEAGRRLFDRSRERRSVVNDADRLRKYLLKFALSWEHAHGSA